MRAFKTKRLARWAKKEDLTDASFWQAAKEVAAGHVEASLGRCLFKKRIARPGKGKSSGYRTIVAFKSDNGDTLFFVYGFAKNQQTNITAIEQHGLSIIAQHYLDASETVLENLITDGELIAIEEVENHE